MASIPQDIDPCLIVQEADLCDEGASVGHRDNNHVPTEYLTCQQMEFKASTYPSRETVAVDIKPKEESIPQVIVQGPDLCEEGGSPGQRDVVTEYLTSQPIQFKVKEIEMSMMWHDQVLSICFVISILILR